jgi:Chaperone of endosialidase
MPLDVQFDIDNTTNYWSAGQIVTTGATDTNKRLVLGFDTTNNVGFIQPYINGTGYNNLLLDPAGGNVGIGNLNPSYKLDVTGQARFTGNYTTSDRRLKTNIADIGYGLGDVMKLHPVFFDWKKPVKGEEGRRVGFIAQEVREVIPELVSIAPDAMQTEAVEYGNVTPVLVKAIQELKTDNDDLQARVATDDAAIAAMKAKLGM